MLTAVVLLCFSGALAQRSDSPKLIAKPLTLPGANGLVMLDYVAFDRMSQRLWVPAGNTGTVDVIDSRTDRIR